MINLVAHNKRTPSWQLAKKIALVLSQDPEEREGLAFLLSGQDKKMKTVLERSPHAFEDFRTSWDRQDDDTLKID
jgi:hypothetical protein